MTKALAARLRELSEKATPRPWRARHDLIAEIANNLPAILSALEENEEMRAALRVPDVWSPSERDGMAIAFDQANRKHGHYEALFAVAAWLLRHRARAALKVKP